MKFFATFLLVSFNFLTAFSQTEISQPDTSVARDYFAKAEKFAKQALYDSSNTYFDKASRIYETIGNSSGEVDAWQKYVACFSNIALNLQEQGKYPQAMENLEKALHFGMEKLEQDCIEIANVFHIIGVVHFRQGHYDEALEYYNKALVIRIKRLGEDHPRVADTYNNLGIIFTIKGEYQQALDYYLKSLAIFKKAYGDNHPRVAINYTNLGYIYREKCDYERALDYFTKALDIDIKALGENHPGVASTYNNLGIVYSLKGDYEKAFEFYNKSLAIKLDILGENHPSVAAIYNNMGSDFRERGDLNKALEYLNKSLQLKIDRLGEDHPSTANDLGNIGIIYSQQHEYDKAMTYFEKSLAIRLKAIGENDPFVARIYRDMANVYSEIKNFDRALEYYEKALAISIQLWGPLHTDVAMTYLELAYLYNKQRNFDKTFYYTQQAIMALVPNFSDTSIFANPQPDQTVLEKDLLEVLIFKAKSLADYYTQQSDKIIALETSLSTYQLAAALIENIRRSYKAVGSKLILGERAAEVFENGIKTALMLADITRNDKYNQHAFSFAEQAKASVLLNSLQESQARQFADIPDSLLFLEQELRIDLTFYDTQFQKEQQKEQNRDDTKIKEFQAEFFKLNNQYQRLIDHFETDYPAYYDLKYKTQTTSISDLQKTISDNSALVEYFLGDSLLTIFTITSDSFFIVSQNVDTGFISLVELFTTAIKKIDIQKYIQLSFRLYEELIQPLETNIQSKQKLIIIPHSVLFKVPFEALLRTSPQNTGKIDFTELDYLLRTYEISYHNSAALYLTTYQSESNILTVAEKASQKYIGFAPVFSEKQKNGYILADNVPVFDFWNTESDVRSVSIDGKRFNPLKYSEQEVRTVVNNFLKNGSYAVGYYHKDASEENFKSTVSDYNIIHIASHGIINDQKPQLSGIIFSQPTDSTYFDDGILYASETFNLNLSAELVVLSSCESGIGKLIRGEGLMALTRGFLYAGARNIVVSLWKISDKHTQQLMVKFYDQILSGRSYSQSLREAKLSMLSHQATAFPKSWSGFVLIGK